MDDNRRNAQHELPKWTPGVVSPKNDDSTKPTSRDDNLDVDKKPKKVASTKQKDPTAIVEMEKKPKIVPRKEDADDENEDEEKPKEKKPSRQKNSEDKMDEAKKPKKVVSTKQKDPNTILDVEKKPKIVPTKEDADDEDKPKKKKPPQQEGPGDNLDLDEPKKPKKVADVEKKPKIVPTKLDIGDENEDEETPKKKKPPKQGGPGDNLDVDEPKKPKKVVSTKEKDSDAILDVEKKPKNVRTTEEADEEYEEYDLVQSVQIAFKLVLNDMVKYYGGDFQRTREFKELATKKGSVSQEELKKYIMNDGIWHNAFYTFMTVNNRRQNPSWESDFSSFQCASLLNEALQAKDDYEHFIILFDKAFAKEDGKIQVLALLANHGKERDQIYACLKRYWSDKDSHEQAKHRSKKKHDSDKEKKVLIMETSSVGSITITSPGKSKGDGEKQLAAPADLVVNIETAFHEMLDSLMMSTMHVFMETKAFKALKLKEEFETKRDFGLFILESSSCSKAFRAFCKEQKLGCYSDRLECVVRLNKALKKKDDYVNFMILFDDAFEKVVVLVNNFNARKTLRECHDAFWDKEKKQPKPLSRKLS